MKKVLLTSTALVAFTGAAAAEVTLSGRAEMGIFASSDAEAQFFTDIDVTFTMSGETDNGLSFGASVDLDEGGDGSDASDNNAEDGGATIFISGSFGTVTMGDTDGALDWAVTEAGNIGNPGSIADDETIHAGYLDSFGDGLYDGQILRYDYSVADFGFAVSTEIDDENEADEGFAIGGTYTIDLAGAAINLGLGYQYLELPADPDPDDYVALTVAGVSEGDDIDIVGLSAATTFANGISLGIQYSNWDVSGDGVDLDHVGVGIGYTTGPISLHANYGRYDTDNGDVKGFGLAAAYDLGGGAVIHAGYSEDDVDDASFDASRASLGLGLSF